MYWKKKLHSVLNSTYYNSSKFFFFSPYTVTCPPFEHWLHLFALLHLATPNMNKQNRGARQTRESPALFTTQNSMVGHSLPATNNTSKLMLHPTAPWLPTLKKHTPPVAEICYVIIRRWLSYAALELPGASPLRTTTCPQACLRQHYTTTTPGYGRSKCPPIMSK